MNACPNGMLDDLEDGDEQTLKTDNRGGYWFTYVDKFGPTIEPKKFKPEVGGPPGSKLSSEVTVNPTICPSTTSSSWVVTCRRSPRENESWQVDFACIGSARRGHGKLRWYGFGRGAFHGRVR